MIAPGEYLGKLFLVISMNVSGFSEIKSYSSHLSPVSSKSFRIGHSQIGGEVSVALFTFVVKIFRLL